MNERKKILEEEKADAQTKEKKKGMKEKKTNEGKKNGMKTRKKRRVPSDLP